MNRNSDKTPPRLAEMLLNYILPDMEYDTPLGDFEEYFKQLSVEKGATYSYLWYWGQVLGLLPRRLYSSLIWGLIMLKNYLKVTWRTIKKQKGFSFINISGLAIGIAGCILITLWVLDELSYDDFHEKASLLYRVEQDQDYDGENFHVNVTPCPMAPALKDEIPEVADASRYMRAGGLLFRHKETTFFEDDIRAVDPSYLNMFNYQAIEGDLSTALDDPYSLVIDEEIAIKYFGYDNPIGKVVTVNNEYEFTVSAVINKVPHNSVLQFNVLIPYKFMELLERTNDSWGSNNIFTFVLLHKGSDIKAVNEKISVLRHKNVIDLVRRVAPDRLEDYSQRPRVEFSLMPLTDIHLHQYFGFGHPMGRIQYVYIFSAIAFLVLIIACINFMNLSTARSVNRAKEVGMRKVIGAAKGNLIKQFYSESIIYAIIALIFGLILVQLFIPVFNGLSGKELTIYAWANWRVLVVLILITFVTGLISGSYPALFLSAFQPVVVLKSSLISGRKSGIFRKILVVIQFGLSIFLIIGTAVVYNQLDFMLNKNLGYDKDHLVTIPMRGEIRQSYKTLKKELLREPAILGVSGSGQSPTFISSNSGGARWDGKDPQQNVLIGYNPVDFDYIKTMKIEMLEGREFSEEFATDTSMAFVVNEEVVKIMGVQSGVNKNFNFAGRNGKIIGVMKNFHYQPISRKIEPIAFIVSPSSINYILIRIHPEQIRKTMAFIEETWKKILPSYPFDYYFLDEKFDNLYRSEQRMGDLLTYFASFAILIASLGLFGLAAFTAEQRTKEIGIRKVLGATAYQIVFLLCKEFFLLVAWASILAWPVSWMIMANWLQGFAYQQNMQWYTFLFAAVFALVVATLTVSYQAIKVAISNPVISLKYE